MKKCPYCAEEIQGEAIKCRHCGEWLAVPPGDTGTEQSDISREGREEKDKIVSVEHDLEPATPRTTDSTQYNEIPGVKTLFGLTLPKKPGKYGWGWLFFLGILANYITKNDPFTDYILSFIWNISMFLFSITYFALRWRFLKKWEFPGSKPWKAGLAAGICTYLMIIIVLCVMLFLDARFLNTSIVALEGKYKGSAASFKQVEDSHRSRFISEPQTKRDIEQNMKTIDEIMAYTKEKQKFFHEMLNDYKQTLKDKRTPKGKKSWGDLIDQILAVYDKSNENQLKAWVLLKKYYITDEEKYYQDYTTTYQTAEQLADDCQRLTKETFGITANIK